MTMEAPRAVQTGKRKSRQDSQQSPRHRKRVKLQDARAIAVQTTGKAYANGEIDVDKFVQAREFEIRALEDGMKRAKKSLTTRAFQNVPRDLRRRTASHNVKKVPRRLRARAAKEMVEDNTPTGSARKRKLRPRLRLRLETRKKLHTSKSRSGSKSSKFMGLLVRKVSTGVNKSLETHRKAKAASREPRVKKNTLQTPPKPKARFRKRQIHKAWLPTHLFHAKRACMTPPKEPLWRMAIPLSPTAKSYRPTHRASTLRGAVAWDMSYMSTIGLEGPEKSLQGLFIALGVGKDERLSSWDSFTPLWYAGSRFWEGWLYEREAWPRKSIAPALIIWRKEQASSTDVQHDQQNAEQGKFRRAKQNRRKAFVRVHPSAFLHLWKEVLRLAKVQKPSVTVEDLRFEVGSIDLIGPASADALFQVLRHVKGNSSPFEEDQEIAQQATALLRKVTNPATLPENAIFAFDALDPRLHHGYKQHTASGGNDVTDELIKLLAQWPVDKLQKPPRIFDRLARLTASRRMPSQKSINRRKSLSEPGKEPASLPTDPSIPILVCAKRGGAPAQGSWTVLLPWKCVLPVWYCLMYQRMESGGTIRFGGLDEVRQIAFECGSGWFPGDLPGTDAGKAWGAREDSERKAIWDRKPPGRRTAYDSIDLGRERKGEIGQGWSCDWPKLLSDETKSLSRIPPSVAVKVLRGDSIAGGLDEDTGLLLVKITLIARGSPKTCARIYSLPTEDEELRNKWLDLLSASKKHGITRGKQSFQRGRIEDEDDPMTRRQRLAARLLRLPPGSITAATNGQGGAEHPVVPDATDLIGFVTTGNFNLGEGKGTAIGNIVLSKVLRIRAKISKSHQHLCIIRESGQAVGRLARWELIF